MAIGNSRYKSTEKLLTRGWSSLSGASVDIKCSCFNYRTCLVLISTGCFI